MSLLDVLPSRVESPMLVRGAPPADPPSTVPLCDLTGGSAVARTQLWARGSWRTLRLAVRGTVLVHVSDEGAQEMVRLAGWRAEPVAGKYQVLRTA
jgi:hypothetical protein